MRKNLWFVLGQDNLIAGRWVCESVYPPGDFLVTFSPLTETYRELYRPNPCIPLKKGKCVFNRTTTGKTYLYFYNPHRRVKIQEAVTAL